MSKKRTPQTGGFTVLEATLSAVVFALVVTGLVTTTAGFRRISAADPVLLSGERFVNNRVAVIQLHKDYETLQAVFAGSRSDLPRLPGAVLNTDVTRVERGQGSDHTNIKVSLSGPTIRDTIQRTLTIKAPVQ